MTLRPTLPLLLTTLLTMSLALGACSGGTDLGEVDFKDPDNVNNASSNGSQNNNTGENNTGENNAGENNNTGENNAGDNSSIMGCVDADGDGVSAGEDCAGVTDCDDSDDQISPFAIDVCDGMDNDCSGASDDNVQTPSCPLEMGVCANSTARCVEGGLTLCGPEDYGSDYVLTEGPDHCDGMDNDCDGDIDEECVCETDDTQDCGPQAIGACVRGTQTCVGGGWAACEGVTDPVDEICDGIDNNCDGETDEELTTLCENQEGVCAGSLAECGGEAGWSACGHEQFGESYTEDEGLEHCDGLDNDCDGSIDEGCECVVDQTRPCGLSVGKCREGVETCEGGRWGECEGGQGPVEEVCDGFDNNCDNTVDEGCDCIEEETRDCGEDTGTCTIGTQRCTDGAWGECDGQAAIEEVCDGLDNDCDGDTDEEVDNACGGCGVLEGAPNEPCGECGTLECDANGGLRCVDPGHNPCGGCGGTMLGEPGEACNDPMETITCGRWICNPSERLQCFENLPNGCGGCRPLDNEPGAACGECEIFGRYECEGDDETVCREQDPRLQPDDEVLICPGSFVMGAREGEPGRGNDEVPRHPVTLTRAFTAWSTELTNADASELAEFQGTINGDPFPGGEIDEGCPGCPFNFVNWFEALEIANIASLEQGKQECYALDGCSSLALLDGCDPVDGCVGGTFCTTREFVGLDCTGYRLPTEAEWEYMARAGVDQTYYWGNTDPTSGCNWSEIIASHGYYCAGDSPDAQDPDSAQPAGLLIPNDWGLYDVSGNVNEWVWDGMGNYTSTAQTDPINNTNPSSRVLRGGSWLSPAANLRTANRHSDTPTVRSTRVGLRLVRTVVPD